MIDPWACIIARYWYISHRPYALPHLIKTLQLSGMKHDKEEIIKYWLSMDERKSPCT